MSENPVGNLFKKSSDAIRQHEEIEYIRKSVLCKFPLLGVQMSKLQTIADVSVGTAGTDGKTIYYSPAYFATLTDEEKCFVYAHEVMHVAFNHILRSGDRDHRLWNMATDAVINQMLKSDSMPMPAGGVDIADAIHHSAEEMYEKLLREKEEQGENSDGQDKQRQSGRGADSGEDENEQAGHDNHEIWKEAVKRHEREEKKKEQESKGGKPEREFDNWNPSNESEFEKGFEEQNRQEKSARAAQVRAMLNREKNRAMREASLNSARTFGNVGKSTAVVDWKMLLKRSIATEQERWSYRRANADNDYMARVEDLDDEDKAQTEVLLDTSGSVSDEFLREFLRQLKPLLKNSKLRVGCFDHRFHPFVEIKTDKDIDNFRIPNKGNTDWDLAVKSFTKKKHINKIIFTDGETPGRMPDAGCAGINIIWLVYGNEEFNPICGKVIRVAQKQIEQNYLIGKHAARGR
jgi:predicted metal-dependent peptidase